MQINIILKMVQCNKFNFHLVVCEFQPIHQNVTKVMNTRGMMGQTGLGDKTGNLNTMYILSPKFRLTHHSSCIHNSSFLYHNGVETLQTTK